MFTDSLIESSGHIHTRRGWAALFSVAIQSIAFAVMILVPMIITHTGPLKVFAAQSFPFTQLNAQPPAEHPRPVRHESAQNNQTENVITTPTVIPDTIDLMTVDFKPKPIGLDCHGCLNIPGPVGPSVVGAVPSEKPSPTPVIKPVEHVGPVRKSVVELGELLNQVKPQYPSICRAMHCQGQVVLHAIISRDGTIESLQIVSSAHPMLGQAALDAVRQWRYRPYKLNGEAVEVETLITVNFSMGSN